MTNQKVVRVLLKVITCSIITTEELKKILKRTTIEPEKKCWFYNKDWSYYAIYKKHGLHRLMYQIFKGELEEGKFICHHCDRPGCINPDHLYQGTAKENFRDAIVRKRLIRSKINQRINPLELDRLRELDKRKKLLESNHAYWTRK